jgi:WD40 repeat protein
MAPEQASGKIKEIGPQTDVYALGAILYAMLTGRPPFTAETTWDVVAQVVSHEPVPPRRLQPTVPRDLETICLKCLHKEARRRYASALELADDLHRFQTSEPILARPAGPIRRLVKWTRRHPARATLLGVSAVAMVAFILVGIIYNARLQAALDDAQAKGEDSFRRSLRLQVANGSRLADDGDWFGALVWYTQALSMEEERPEQVEMHRIRVGTFFRHCPGLEQVFYHAGGIGCVEFSGDGNYLLVTGRAGGVWLYNLRAEKPADSVRAFDPDQLAVAGAFDGHVRLATAMKDGKVQVWDVVTGKSLSSQLNYGAPIDRLALSHNGRLLVAVGGANKPALWDATTGDRLERELASVGTVNDACFSPDDRWLAVGSADKSARVLQVVDGRPVSGPLLHPSAVTQVLFSPDGRTLATVASDRKVRLWEPRTAKLLSILEHRDTVNQVSFSSDSQWLITACTDAAARMWNVASGRQRGLALRHFSEVNRASFSQDGSRVVTAGDDNTARLWDAATQELLPPLLRHHGTVECAAFSPDGKWLATASKDRLVRLWSVRPERLLPVFQHTVAAPTGQDTPAWRKPEGLSSPDQRVVLKAVDLNSVRVWDAETGEPVGPALKHNSDILSASFSPDNRRVLSSSDDNTARVWDPASGELAAPPLTHQSSVNWAAFSPDGRKVVTASTDRTARVWDMATGDPLSPPLSHPCEVRQAGFSTDGLWVVTTGTDNIERRWDLRPDDRAVADLVRLAQVLAGSHIDPARGFLPLGPERVRSAWQEVSGVAARRK